MNIHKSGIEEIVIAAHEAVRFDAQMSGPRFAGFKFAEGRRLWETIQRINRRYGFDGDGAPDGHMTDRTPD